MATKGSGYVQVLRNTSNCNPFHRLQCKSSFPGKSQHRCNKIDWNKDPILESEIKVRNKKYCTVACVTS